MADERLVVVGGGPAGLAAARGFREAGGTGEVILLSGDEHPPYARPPLTKDYARGQSGPEDLPLAPDSWYVDQRVALQLQTCVTGIELATHRVRLADGSDVDYDRLVLAMGSTPKPLPAEGADLPGLVYVRDRHSGDILRSLARPGHRVIVAGSGFIGCEAAASLALSGAEVVLVTDEQVPHAARLGEQAGRRIAQWLRDAGVELRLGAGVAEIAEAENWTVIQTDGSEVTGDAVVAGSGAAPRVELAEAAGLAMASGAVAVDASLQTSDPAVWAAGDIAFAENPAAGRALRVEHWGEAETMGEIAGRNAATGRGEERWAKAPGFWTTIGDHTLKYSAWGDGYARAELVEHGDGWAVWYAGDDDTIVGVLTSEWDEAYEQGQSLIERHASIAEALP